jgi:hypothetical protein
VRGASRLGVLLILAGGCAAGEPREAAPSRPAGPVSPPAPAETRPRASTEGPEAVVTASGGGALRDQTPPQRRFRLIGAPPGLGGGLGMRVVEEPNVTALPPSEAPVPVPEPEITVPPLDPEDIPPPVAVPEPR